MNKKILLISSLILAIVFMTGYTLAVSYMNPRITYTGEGTPNPMVGRVGDLYIDLATNNLYVFGSNNWTIFAVLPTPINGTVGLKGDKGDQGIAGLNGTNGTDGKDGINGTNGIDGKDGATGLQGIQGETGATGQSGLDGKDGVNGIDGINGLNGTNGRDGQNGSDASIYWLVYLIAGASLVMSGYAVYNSRKKNQPTKK